MTSIILNSHHTGLHWFDQDPMNTVTHTPRIFGKQLSTIETVLELATLNYTRLPIPMGPACCPSLLKASTESVCTEHVPSAAPWSQTCFGGHGHARVPAPARPVHPIESNTLEQAADYRSKRGEKSLGPLSWQQRP